MKLKRLVAKTFVGYTYIKNKSYKSYLGNEEQRAMFPMFLNQTRMPVYMRKTAVLNSILNSFFVSYWYNLTFEKQKAQTQLHNTETYPHHINNTQKRGAVQAIVKQSNTRLPSR